jgi:hypothetical protein
MFTTAAKKWCDRPDNEWTMPNFTAHFTKVNKESIRKLTAQTAGYHGANSATAVVPAAAVPAAANAATPPPAVAHSPRPNTAGTMYYCWTHGLGKNRAHTSLLCNTKAADHKDNATVDNMLGGNNTIMQCCPPSRPHPND